jgi:hypothetical protein
MKKFVLTVLTGAVCFAQTSLSPSTMPRVAEVDERFQSFNVEMVEVTGGRFWKPFGKDVDAILNAPKAGPRPNYWSAVLWRRLMGTTVLNPGPSEPDTTHVYAQCLRGRPGGVALLIVNADRTNARTMKIPTASVRYTLTAPALESGTVQLNGIELKLGAEDELPELAGVPAKAGNLRFAPASITFLAVPQANNTSCK